MFREQALEAGTKQEDDGSIFGAVQLILAEKRTSLASLRTGIALFALPLSVLGLLIATSRYYQPLHVLHLLVPLLALCGALVILGSFLVIQSIRHIHRYDRMIRSLKRQHSALSEFLE